MDEPTYGSISLATKPGPKLTYSFTPPTTTSPKSPLLIFINGLGIPQTSWAATISFLQTLRPHANPAILTYDRFGQGQTTDRDPQDEKAEDPMHGHDCMDVVRDLHQLVTQHATQEGLVKEGEDVGGLSLVLAGNSVGCAIARLYAQTYAGTVAGMLLLDSVLANSDFVSIFPDPDASDFASSALPSGITPDVLRQARAIMAKIFHPRNGSKEGLSRKNLASLLPRSDEPKLEGPDGKGPWVTVVGHDWEVFAQNSTAFGMPYEATMIYANPFWGRYNEGLVRIAGEGRGRGPVIAQGADHFVQKDNPKVVAEEIDLMLDKIMS